MAMTTRAAVKHVADADGGQTNDDEGDAQPFQRGNTSPEEEARE